MYTCSQYSCAYYIKRIHFSYNISTAYGKYSVFIEYVYHDVTHHGLYIRFQLKMLHASVFLSMFIHIFDL